MCSNYSHAPCLYCQKKRALGAVSLCSLPCPCIASLGSRRAVRGRTSSVVSIFPFSIRCWQYIFIACSGVSAPLSPPPESLSRRRLASALQTGLGVFPAGTLFRAARTCYLDPPRHSSLWRLVNVATLGQSRQRREREREKNEKRHR